MIAREPELRRQLVHNPEPPEDVGDMNGCDPAGGGIAHDNRLGGQEHLLELLRRADVRLRRILAHADADRALRDVDNRRGDDVAICRHLIENDSWQDRDVSNLAALEALSQLAGLVEADADLLSGNPRELRLKLADDFSHAAGAKDFHFSGIHGVRCEIGRAGQCGGEHLVDH